MSDFADPDEPEERPNLVKSQEAPSRDTAEVATGAAWTESGPNELCTPLGLKLHPEPWEVEPQYTQRVPPDPWMWTFRPFFPAGPKEHPYP